jgi:hypothetical protein
MLSEGLDDDAPIPRRRAVLNRLIAEIRIEGPDAIYPTFKFPMKHLRDQTVRPLFRVVDPGEQYVNPDPEIGAAPVDLSGRAEPIERCRRSAGDGSIADVG